MARTFKGGIHPFEGKDITKDKPVEDLKPAGLLVFPLNQHAGKPAIPIVKVGELVLAGQKIAEADGVVSANIHSSVSGKVKAIEPRTLPTGGKSLSIVIENDGEYSEVEYEVKDPKDLTNDEIVERIREAGVVGMGGGAFPTAAKFAPDDPDAIRYLVINGAECEPYLTSDYKVMLESADKIVKGIKIALRLFPNAEAVIGIEDNKPEAIKALTDACADEINISVRSVKTKYPQGSDRTLVQVLTGIKVKPIERSNKKGVVVSNVTSLLNTYEAVVEGRPLIKRIFTVSGDDIVNPGNFRVYLGTAFSEVIEAAGGTIQDPEKYIDGGTMMGFAMYDLSAPITKTSSALLAVKHDDVSNSETTPCINCGKCVSVCPMQLLPNKLSKMSERNLLEDFEKNYGMYCIECGCCSYVCPAKIPLKQSIKSMKAAIKVARSRKKVAKA